MLAAWQAKCVSQIRNQSPEGIVLTSYAMENERQARCSLARSPAPLIRPNSRGPPNKSTRVAQCVMRTVTVGPHVLPVRVGSSRLAIESREIIPNQPRGRRRQEPAVEDRTS